MLLPGHVSAPSKFSQLPTLYPSSFCKSLHVSTTTVALVGKPQLSCKSSEAEELASMEDEWLKRLADKKKPLYSHSLPYIEFWLRDLGFFQSKNELAVWFIEKLDWHAQLSLDVTDLYIRYLKSGPGNLEKNVERRFSYALSKGYRKCHSWRALNTRTCL